MWVLIKANPLILDSMFCMVWSVQMVFTIFLQIILSAWNRNAIFRFLSVFQEHMKKVYYVFVWQKFCFTRKWKWQTLTSIFAVQCSCTRNICSDFNFSCTKLFKWATTIHSFRRSLYVRAKIWYVTRSISWTDGEFDWNIGFVHVHIKKSYFSTILDMKNDLNVRFINICLSNRYSVWCWILIHPVEILLLQSVRRCCSLSLQCSNSDIFSNKISNLLMPIDWGSGNNNGNLSLNHWFYFINWRILFELHACEQLSRFKI